LGLSYNLLRGGSWNNNARNCRAGNRNRNNARKQNNNIGFRLLLASSSWVLSNIRIDASDLHQAYTESPDSFPVTQVTVSKYKTESVSLVGLPKP
jgi:hypothetical protein